MCLLGEEQGTAASRFRRLHGRFGEYLGCKDHGCIEPRLGIRCGVSEQSIMVQESFRLPLAVMY